MGVRDYLPSFPDSGGPVGVMENRVDVHHECRTCGRNATADCEQCPECGGDIVRYDLE